VLRQAQLSAETFIAALRVPRCPDEHLSEAPLSTPPPVSLLIDQEAPEDLFTDVMDALTQAEIDAVMERRAPEGPYAALDWLIPTGIILYIAKPYFDTILRKAAEHHVALLSAAGRKLWAKCFGNRPAIERVVRGPGGVVKESPFSRAISVTAQARDGSKITLLFPNEAVSEEFALAVEKFELLMLEHHAKGGGSLGAALAQGEAVPSHWQQLVYLNPKTRQLELIDYIRSSMQGELVATAIAGAQR